MRKYLVLTFWIFGLLIIAPNAQSCSANTLTVTGNGKTLIKPDIAEISLTAAQNGATTSEALSKVNTMINQIFGILAVQQVPASNYSTTAISFQPRYNYSGSTPVYVGQKASQSLTITYGQVNNVAALLNSLSVVNVTFDSLSFSTSNTSAAKKQARINAVNDAKTKLNQLLSLSYLKNGGVKQVTDLNEDKIIRFSANPSTYAKISRSSQQYGTVEVDASVQVIWGVQ